MPPRFGLGALLLALVPLGCGGCHGEQAPALPGPVGSGSAAPLAAAGADDPADPTPVVATTLVQDFEEDLTIGKWPRQAAETPARSSAWKASGASSLQIPAGLVASFESLAVRDFSKADILRLHVHNENPVASALEIELQDEHPAASDRHRHETGAAPGDSVVDLDIAGDLWRGNEDFSFRGEVKTPFDKSNVRVLAIKNRGGAAVYVDRIELIELQKLAVAGGFAFDFGKTESRVMGQLSPVFETTLFTPERGYGFTQGSATGLTRTNSLPTAALGDGLAWNGDTFRVDLHAGKYLGWIAFERGGFWDLEGASYLGAKLSANGVVVHEHTFGLAGQHFLLEDAEATTVAEAVDRLVFPGHGVARFRFDALEGANAFTLALEGSKGWPLRVAELVLAPDTPEGKAFVDAHEALQKRGTMRSFPMSDRGRRGAGRVAPSGPFVVQRMLPGEAMAPRDFPLEAPPAEPPIVAAPGQVVAVQLGVYAPAAGTATARATALAGPSGTPLAAAVSHGRYVPMRPLNQGPAWVLVDHYRPEPSFTVGPELARPVLVEWELPVDAKAGAYTAQVTISLAGSDVTVPIAVKVVAASLARIPKPVCFLRNALPFGPEAVGEARWWELQEALLRAQGNAGMTCVTGGPGLYYDVRDGAGGYVLTGERPLRYLELAKKYGLDQAVLSYGAFLPPFRKGQVMLPNRQPADPKKLVEAIRAFEKERSLPPQYFYAYDEPQADGERKRAAEGTRAVTEVGGRTLGFTSVFWGNAIWEELLAATAVPCLHGYQADDVGKLRAMGKPPWTYAAEHDRSAFGHGLFRALELGVEGRVEWIGMLAQGMAFDNLDGRSAADAAWVVHDKLGIMPTPAWLSSREGLYDLRARLALGKLAAKDDPALALWPADAPFRHDPENLPDRQLANARAAMLERLAELEAGKR